MPNEQDPSKIIDLNASARDIDAELLSNIPPERRDEIEVNINMTTGLAPNLLRSLRNIRTVREGRDNPIFLRKLRDKFGRKG